MARKNIGTVLSDGAVVLCVVLLCALNVSVQAAIEGTMKEYTISGSIPGLSGVTMKGLPNNPVTDDTGYYSDTVKWGWNGTVTPQKAGYTFEPAKRPYPKVTSDQSNQDYIATLKTFTISGTVRMDGAAMEGVIIDGLPGNPITDSNGTYEATVDYNWTGNATPSKNGYQFTPTSKPYTSVTRDMTMENYSGAVVTFTISGSAGVEGAVMNGLPGNPKTGRNGIYSTEVDYNWSGTVRPSKDGYTFEPTELPYTDVFSNYTDQNYTATLITFTISGTAGIDGVEMNGFPGPAVFTDQNGYYSTSVPWNWSGTVKPLKPGYNFDTATITYTKLRVDRADQNYTPIPITLTISGRIGNMDGVTMEGLPGNPVTKGGLYSATVDWNWTGAVTPKMDGYEFTPANKPYTAITTDQKNNNYTAKLMTFMISGFAGTSGVTMKGLPGRPVISDNDGIYSALVDYGWSGTIKPEKAGYTFDPTELPYTDVFSDYANQDYTAALMKHTISGTIRSDKGELVEDVFILADNDGGSDTTDANGEYELTVNYGWRGKATPTKLGYNFRPTNKPYTAPVTRDLSNQLFTAILKTFTISDIVMVGGTPIEGVQVTANNGGGTATTATNGRFTVTVPYDWSGEITLSKEGFDFPSKSYANVTENYKDDLPESATRPPTPTPEPTPTTPTPTPIPTPVVPKETPEWTELAPPTTIPEVNEAEMTPLERDIARIRAQLDDLIKKAAAPPVEPNALVPGEPLITRTFIDDDLVDALQTIASMAGVTIVTEETVIGTVTCELVDVPLETALGIVLAHTPYIVHKTPYYYLVCPGDVKSTLFPVVSETRRIRMNYITAEAAVGLLSTAFKDYVQAEIGVPGTDTYTVCVTAPPMLMERIISDLEQIDRLPSQVLLNARIVVMERGDLLNLGVEWTWPRVSAGLFSNDLRGIGTEGMLDFGGKFASGIHIGYTPDSLFTNALEAALNLLEQNDEATVLASPQVMARDGKKAELQVMTEEYYMMTSAETGFYYTRSELQTVESGTTLSITPHIGDNNDITLELAIEVSDSIPRGRGSDLPVVTRRKSSNTVLIKDGGTVAVAGLTENRTRLGKRKVPGLGNLPLIGPLFRNTNDEKASREIAVFVTAYIIPEASRALEFAEPSTVQAPIRPVEQDFRMRLRESLSRPIR